MSAIKFSMQMLAYCGLYCDLCSFKAAYETQNREHILRMPARYDRDKTQPMQPCPGCKGDNICGDCAMKDCACGRNLDHCGQCAEYPCAELLKFAGDGVPHHAGALKNLERIREVGADAWFAEQQTHCNCGERSSWYCHCPVHNG